MFSLTHCGFWRATPASPDHSSLTVHIDQSVLAGTAEEASMAYPAECCGLLMGHRRPTSLTITSHRSAANLARDSRRAFTLDPDALLAVIREIRSSAPTVDRTPQFLGFYHSHPNGSIQPSRADLASAWPGYFYLIVAVGLAGPPSYAVALQRAVGSF